jgi:hypothetical protein
MYKILLIILLFVSSSISKELDDYEQKTLDNNEKYLRLSSKVYDLEKIDNPIGMQFTQNGISWEVVDYKDKFNISGFTVGTFKNSDTGELVISFGGTTAGKKIKTPSVIDKIQNIMDSASKSLSMSKNPFSKKASTIPKAISL